MSNFSTYKIVLDSRTEVIESTTEAPTTTSNKLVPETIYTKKENATTSSPRPTTSSTVSSSKIALYVSIPVLIIIVLVLGGCYWRRYCLHRASRSSNSYINSSFDDSSMPWKYMTKSKIGGLDR